MILIDASVYSEGTGEMAKLPRLFAYAGVSASPDSWDIPPSSYYITYPFIPPPYPRLFAYAGLSDSLIYFAWLGCFVEKCAPTTIRESYSLQWCILQYKLGLDESKNPLSHSLKSLDWSNDPGLEVSFV